MPERSADHGTFTIERTYDAPPARVYNAWADPNEKPRWFGGDGNINDTYTYDFRIGGGESIEGGPPGGPVYLYRSTIHEIVPNERIVTSYTMDLNGTRISVSIATVELKAASKGTKMSYTEQAVYLDGLDTLAQREEGCTELIDGLGRFLRAETAAR